MLTPGPVATVWVFTAEVRTRNLLGCHSRSLVRCKPVQMVVDRLEGSEQQWGQCPAQKSGRQGWGPRASLRGCGRSDSVYCRFLTHPVRSKLHEGRLTKRRRRIKRCTVVIILRRNPQVALMGSMSEEEGTQAIHLSDVPSCPLLNSPGGGLESHAHFVGEGAGGWSHCVRSPHPLAPTVWVPPRLRSS